MHARRTTPAPDVLIVQPDGRLDHLAGVLEELCARGLTCARQNEPHLVPNVPEGTRVVVVTDTLAPRSLRALRMAHKAQARTLLVMDGLTEFRNTYLNPRVDDAFLRPAPVDRVCCSGLIDAVTLRALGNDATPTGLPRIDTTFQSEMPPARGGPILVATARTPARDADERLRLVEALRELREAARWARARLIWRLTDGLDDELGVRNHDASLWEALADAGAVITTPSTLLVEAMRADRPAALLHTHPTPLWMPAAWVWQTVDADRASAPVPTQSFTHALSRHVDSPERLLRQLSSPTREQLGRQRECLALLDASSGEARAAELVAEAIAQLADEPAPTKERISIRPVARFPSEKPKRDGRRRAVSVVPFGHSPVGGVTTWSRRLGETLKAREDLGFECQTLLVSLEPQNAWRAQPLLDERTSLCVIDPTDDQFVTLSNLRRSIEILEPDLLLPNYTDLSYAVSAQLAHLGVPSVAIAHTDHSSYESCMTTYADWDASVAVSSSIESWLRPLSAQRPMRRIVYGVPSAGTPRRVPDAARLRLAYVGRVVQDQKRVFDLVHLAEQLAAQGCEAELHIVGDGPDDAALRDRLKDTGSVSVVYHGAKTNAWVESFWPTVDVAVLVSAFEGTSITMLEAMGQGVVPAVTRVASGVDDWIEDGVTGVVSGVGEMRELAHKIIKLDRDRERMSAMGTAAWERVRTRLRLDDMAERYAVLFEEVLRTRRPVTRSTRGVEVGSWQFMSKPRTEDPAGEVEWLLARLQEAGYERVDVSEAEPGADAVIIPAGDAGPGTSTLEALERDGIDVVWSGLVPKGGCLTKHLRSLMEDGYRRICVYGLGRHTHRHGAPLCADAFPIVGLIDDDPNAPAEAFGLPVSGRDDAIERFHPDAILLSSDAWERELWERSGVFRELGVHVQPIYAAYKGSSPVLSGVSRD